MTLHVLDPSSESAAEVSQLAPRLASLEGKTVGLISNGKEGTIGFFDHLGAMLKSEFGVARVITQVKSNYSAPADQVIVDAIPEWDAVVSGIGD